MKANKAGVLVDGKAVCLECWRTTPDRERLWQEGRVKVLSSLEGWSKRHRYECVCGARFLGRVI